MKLVSLIDGFEIKIGDMHEVNLGRNGDIHNEYFNKYNSISRKHIKILNNNYIIDMSKNGTKLNYKDMIKGMKYELSLGDILTIGYCEESISFIILDT